MEPYGSQWNPMAYHVTLWNPREIVVILWNDMESYEILWNHLYEPHIIPMGSDAFIKMRLDSCRTLGSSVPHNSLIIDT